MIERRSSHRVTNVNFSIDVGIAVPSRVTIYDLPPDIVEIVPRYRGYKYVIVRDEIVIIHPRTRKIVTVIDADDSMTGSATGSGKRCTCD